MEDTVVVYGARRWNFDGNIGASLQISGQEPEAAEEIVGMVVTDVPCPYELIDKIRDHKFPVQLTLDLGMGRGPKGKTMLVCKGLGKSASDARGASASPASPSRQEKAG